MHMIYLIENQIVFNPEDNSLSLLSDAESNITVSNPARRILSLLIEQQGTVVQRETFFKKVWDDYGLTASNNNLNHCISKLRKVISTLGYVDEFIVTVPKVGFIIRKETTITLQSGLELPQEKDTLLPEEAFSAPEPPVTLHETAPSVPETSEAQEPTFAATHKEHRKIYLIISMITLFTLTTWGLYVLHSVMIDPKAKLLVANIGACELYSTAPVSGARKAEFLQLAQTFMMKQKILCSPGNIFIFQSEQFITPVDTGSVRDFMAQCSTNESHNINICISYYANDRTTHDQF